MPPQRTFPPAKPIKTERTHEENQERAYIAASRRSDRSLEARVESARRASEIHKRRTGRSLRVTEQDVVNEEMYEEEDDDLPMQYRRLTAHLQTNSIDFNRRLAAYLTQHVAMRSALEESINNSYAQQFPNAPQFAHSQRSMFPSPLMTQNINQNFNINQSFNQNQQTQRSPSQASAALQQSPHPFRQAPYPMPGNAGYRQHSYDRPHGLPNSAQKFAASPAETHTSSSMERMSVPVLSASPVTLTLPTCQRPSLAGLMPEPAFGPIKQEPETSHGPSTSMQQQPRSHVQQQPSTQSWNPGQDIDFGPFSTTLPMESQILLGSTLDPQDPLTALLMSSPEHSGQPYFDFNTNYPIAKQQHFDPSYEGMNATLAPNALLSSSSNMDFSNPASQVESPIHTNFGMNPGEFKGLCYAPTGSATGSGSVTPGIDGAWDAFIDDNSWAETGA